MSITCILLSIDKHSLNISAPQLVLMATDNNGKKTINVSVSKETYSKAIEVSDSKDQSVSEFTAAALEHSIQKAELCDVIKQACSSKVVVQSDKPTPLYS